MTSKLLKGNEVADTLNVSKAFAYQLMAEGRIRAVKMGRSVRVRPEDLEQFIRESAFQTGDLSFSVENTPKTKIDDSISW